MTTTPTTHCLYSTVPLSQMNNNYCQQVDSGSHRWGHVEDGWSTTSKRHNKESCTSTFFRSLDLCILCGLCLDGGDVVRCARSACQRGMHVKCVLACCSHSTSRPGNAHPQAAQGLSVCRPSRHVYRTDTELCGLCHLFVRELGKNSNDIGATAAAAKKRTANDRQASSDKDSVISEQLWHLRPNTSKTGEPLRSVATSLLRSIRVHVPTPKGVVVQAESYIWRVSAEAVKKKCKQLGLDGCSFRFSAAGFFEARLAAIVRFNQIVLKTSTPGGVTNDFFIFPHAHAAAWNSVCARELKHVANIQRLYSKPPVTGCGSLQPLPESLTELPDTITRRSLDTRSHLTYPPGPIGCVTEGLVTPKQGKRIRKKTLTPTYFPITTFPIAKTNHHRDVILSNHEGKELLSYVEGHSFFQAQHNNPVVASEQLDDYTSQSAQLSWAKTESEALLQMATFPSIFDDYSLTTDSGFNSNNSLILPSLFGSPSSTECSLDHATWSSDFVESRPTSSCMLFRSQAPFCNTSSQSILVSPPLSPRKAGGDLASDSNVTSPQSVVIKQTKMLGNDKNNNNNCCSREIDSINRQNGGQIVDNELLADTMLKHKHDVVESTQYSLIGAAGAAAATTGLLQSIGQVESDKDSRDAEVGHNSNLMQYTHDSNSDIPPGECVYSLTVAPATTSQSKSGIDNCVSHTARNSPSQSVLARLQHRDERRRFLPVAPSLAETTSQIIWRAGKRRRKQLSSTIESDSN